MTNGPIKMYSSVTRWEPGKLPRADGREFASAPSVPPRHHNRRVGLFLTRHELGAVHDFAVVANDVLAVLVREHGPGHAVNEEPVADHSFAHGGRSRRFSNCRPAQKQPKRRPTPTSVPQGQTWSLAATPCSVFVDDAHFAI